MLKCIDLYMHTIDRIASQMRVKLVMHNTVTVHLLYISSTLKYSCSKSNRTDPRMGWVRFGSVRFVFFVDRTALL